MYRPSTKVTVTFLLFKLEFLNNLDSVLLQPVYDRGPPVPPVITTKLYSLPVGQAE